MHRLGSHPLAMPSAGLVGGASAFSTQPTETTNRPSGCGEGAGGAEAKTEQHDTDNAS